MASDRSARAALTELDKALAEKPHAEGHTFSATAHELSLLRNAIAAGQRATGVTPETLRRLQHVNAIITVVLAGHFPLGGVPWPDLEKARDWLARLVEDDPVLE